MNNLSYSSRYVFKIRMTNIVKLLSLTIGLSLGIMLFTALAYNFTFDNFYKDSERIYVVYADYVNGEQHSRENFAFAPAPLASAAIDEIKEVECAAKCSGPDRKKFKKENSDAEYVINTVTGDANYLDLFSLEVIEGNIGDYTLPGSIFLCESKADEIFSSNDVIGETLLNADGTLYTVRGVIKDFPSNSSWDVEAVRYEKEDFFPTDWTQNHWNKVFLKLAPQNSRRKLSAQAASVEAQLSKVQQRHYDVPGMKAKGQYVSLYLAPLEKHHNLQGSAMSANIIVLVLGIVILVIAGLNYVLLSISSLNSRAKEIGVRKCNGASKWNVFSLLLWETAIYIAIALAISFVSIMAFRGAFETMTSAPLSQIFCFENLYAVLITIIVLFLVSGIIPAQVFSSIPVKQVFMQQSSKRTPWKKALLFVQLFATVFILSFLVVIIRQNNTLFQTSHGVETDNVAFVKLSNVPVIKAMMIRDQLSQKEGVISACVTSHIPMDYPGGGSVVEAGSGVTLFSTRYISSDENFLKTYGVPLLYGDFLSSDSDTNFVVVNEKFVKQAGWDASASVGRQFYYENRLLTIKGVVRDFHLNSFKILEQFPLVMSGYRSTDRKAAKISFKLTNLDRPALDLLNASLAELLPSSDNKIKPYFDEMFMAYEGEVNQKKIVGVGAVAVLLISLIGVISYVSVDVNRRRREIALRRVHGATEGEVLRMISQGISYYSIAASLAGSICCVFMARSWQQEFFVKTPLSPWMFIIISLVVIIAVALTTILQSYKIVSANPSETLRGV